MRILFVHDSLGGGGTERRLVQLIRGLNEFRYDDLHLICLSDVNDYPIIDAYRVSLHVVEGSKFWSDNLFLKIFKLIKEINPEIIHSWSIQASFYVSIACKLLKVPHVAGFITGGTGFKRFSTHSFAKAFIYIFADTIIGNSKAGLNAYNAPRNKAHVIYNGFDLERLGTPTDTVALRRDLDIATKYVVAMAARFEKEKDFDTFFSAANQLLETRNDITFLAVGKGSLFSTYKSKIPQTNKQYIRMLGFRHDIDAIIQITDIGVLCNNPEYGVEGFSNSLMEFMAFGKPVIATKGGGTEELVTDNETGFIIQPKNVAELVEKISLLLKDRELSAKLSLNSKKAIRTMYSLEKITSTYIELYKKFAKLPQVKVRFRQNV